jgi:predicted Fe-Mo cluster-binding NifX family protein
MKATKKFVQSDKQKNNFVISALIGEKRYRFIKDNGINVSYLVRDAIDILIKDQEDGKDIFKRMKDSQCYL